MKYFWLWGELSGMEKVIRINNQGERTAQRYITLQSFPQDYILVDLAAAGEVSSQEVKSLHDNLQELSNKCEKLMIVHATGTEYSFPAQRDLWNLPSVKKVAFVLQERNSRTAIECMIVVAANKKAHVQIFFEQSDAEEWLCEDG